MDSRDDMVAEGPRMERIEGGARQTRPTEPPQAPVPRQHLFFSTYTLVVAVLIVVAAASGLLVDTLRGTSSERADWSYEVDGESSYRTCSADVVEQLLSPQSARFPAWDSADVVGERLLLRGDTVTVRIRGHVDALDEFGSTQREPWTCRAEDNGDDAWVIDLDIAGPVSNPN